MATDDAPQTPAADSPAGVTGRLVPLDGAGVGLVAVMVAGIAGLVLLGVLVLIGLNAPAQ